MSEALNARNISTLHEALKHERSRTDDLLNRIEHLSRQVVMQATEINALRTQMVMVVASRGHGSTSRE